MATDVGCERCWPATAAEAQAGLFHLRREDLVDESHYRVAILQCPDCRQAFVYVFTEIMDMNTGADASYRTTLPITDDEAAELRRQGDAVSEAHVSSLGRDRQSLYVDHPASGEPRVTWGTGILVGPHD